MAIASGTQLGHFEIIALSGSGGMGEVYKARDTRLNRTVAIKVLPAHLSDRPELRERFEREAKTISSLNHPHICTLYDVGHQDGIHYLVMEYLEGETVTERLKKGPLPLDSVLRYSIEIADALDKAHRQGFTHRDLKPGNIILTKSGSKLLDFGLAKFRPPQRAVANMSSLPTERSALTVDGTILGTLQYMAPEQLEGKEADARTDIFAFGAVVYEMATGKKAFEGKSQASLIGAILKDNPPPVSSFQPVYPKLLDHAIRKCLAKEPDDRWQNAGDLGAEFKWIAEEGVQIAAVAPAIRRSRTRERWAWIALAAILFLVATGAVFLPYFRASQSTDTRAMRLSIVAPGAGTISSLAISPDGHSLALVQDGRLWLRPLDSLVASPLLGTESINTGSYRDQLFWSPDSRVVGFFAGGRLKTVDISGGTPRILANAPGTAGRTGTWNRDGVIIYGVFSGSLYRVSASGGQPQPLTALDASRQEISHYAPIFLPDGRHFLYLVISGRPENTGVYVGSLDSKETKLLLAGASQARYVRPGYLLFVRDGILTAHAFDLQRLALSGEAFTAPGQIAVGYDRSTGLADFSVSEEGLLAYRAADAGGASGQLVWMDRAGKQLGTVGPPAGYVDPALSPDGKRAAVERVDPQTGNRDVWLVEFGRAIFTRFTFDAAQETFPVWSPDGNRIVFGSNRSGTFDLYQKLSSGAGSEELLLKPPGTNNPQSWSRDGRFITYSVPDSKGARDIWVLPLFGDRKPFPFMQTPFDEVQSQISPDGKWITYQSAESGRGEVYVQSFPKAGAKWQVSTSGGASTRWRGDGKELFFLSGGLKVMSAQLRGDSALEIETPVELFQAPVASGIGSPIRQQYDVSSDGQRFLINSAVEKGSSSSITVILNWAAGLKR